MGYPSPRPDLKNYKDFFYPSLLFIIIFILSFPKIGGPVSAGLGPSFEFALNYFFLKHIQMGRDIIFTYGPLGFLIFPKPVGHNLLISVIVISLLKIAFLLSFLYLHFLIKKPNTFLSKLGFLVIFAILSFFIDFGSILVFLTASLLLLYAETKSKYFIVLAIAISSFSLLVKPSYGIISILLVTSYSIINYLQFKNIKRLLLIHLGIVLSFIFEWVMIYQGLSGIVDYWYGTLELSFGNSSAMAMSLEDNWILLSIFFLIYFYLVFTVKEKRIFILYGMFLLPSFAFFKYAFTRVDHIHYFFFYIIFFYCLVFACLREFKMRVFLIVLISLCVFFANMKYVRREIRLSRAKLYAINGLKHFEASILNLEDYEKVLLETSRSNLGNKVLEKNVLQIIGSHPVDTYPWETTYVAANNLNWQPRPVFQSYVAYTPWLDKKNAVFFNSPKSPKFIIWDVKNRLSEVESIDGRYLLNDEPLTIYQIINRYRLIYRGKNIVLFEKSFTHHLKEPRLIAYEKSQWGKWIKVPFIGHGITRARINVSRKFIGSLKRFLYKEEEFFIEYKLEDGDIKKYRLVIDNAVSGVWINPFIVKFLRVPRIRLHFVKRLRKYQGLGFIC